MEVLLSCFDKKQSFFLDCQSSLLHFRFYDFQSHRLVFSEYDVITLASSEFKIQMGFQLCLATDSIAKSGYQAANV